MNDQITTSVESMPPLSYDDIVKVIRKARFESDKIVKEIKVLNHNVWTCLFSDEDDQPTKPLNALYGIPVVSDPSIPYNKIKIIYANGKEKILTLNVRHREIHTREQSDRRD